MISLYCQAQLLVNNGQVLHTDHGAKIRIQGSFMNDSSAFSDHNGNMVIDSSFINVHKSTQKGDGAYGVYGDWQNSAHFLRDTSYVHLLGNLQYLKGDSATSFYNLSAEGSGRKIMRINASVFNCLQLHGLELATDQDTLFIENASPGGLLSNTVFGSEGFVSTLDSGCLVRKTSGTNTYYFPFGSIAGTPRFRPVIITPDSGSVNQYGLSMQNKKADLDKYYVANKDSDVCKVNPLFYHTIQRLSGSSACGITIGYLKAIDGIFSEIGNWQMTTRKWENIHNGAVGIINNYQAVNRAAWNSFTSKPFALLNFKPVIDSITGPDLLCKQIPETFSSVTDNLSDYVFSWSSTGGNFKGGSTQPDVTLLFTVPGSKNVFLTILDTVTGCASGLFTKSIQVFAGPRAGFGISYQNLFENVPITFLDSSSGSVQWAWNFGNGQNSTIENPQTAFANSGVYTIRQIVTDKNGCQDSVSKSLDIKCSLKVPNVFTPNGDGVNDVFLIQGLCITQYTLEILDRWGLLVYSGNQSSAAWDGHTPSGQMCPEGTYYYTLKAEIENETERTTENSAGFITLLK